MKIRSTADLNEAIDRELSWRKTELQTLNFVIEKQKDNHEKDALFRAAVPILYAHWEGFTKQAAMFYLELVSRQQLKLSELESNFAAIVCRSYFKKASESEKVSVRKELIDFIRENNNKRAIVPTDNVIDTESNLSSAVLQSIFYTIGLPYHSFWMMNELLLDGSLLKARNEIVHGEHTDIDKETYKQLHELVIRLMDNMRTDIQNAAILKQYRI
ncbi:MAG: hypothetical protein BWK80_15845 [Desulfobacteraceae bacterium IS3]|nr:MAG: hypothetical protein BWK80_15845 [Desulfobacteraceae bacterium IS3]